MKQLTDAASHSKAVVPDLKLAERPILNWNYCEMFLQIGVRFCRVDRVDSAEGGREARADSARQVCQPGDTGPAHRQRQGTRCLRHSGQATPSSLTFLSYLHFSNIPFVSPLRFHFFSTCYLSVHHFPHCPLPDLFSTGTTMDQISMRIPNPKCRLLFKIDQ